MYIGQATFLPCPLLQITSSMIEQQQCSSYVSQTAVEGNFAITGISQTFLRKKLVRVMTGDIHTRVTTTCVYLLKDSMITNRVEVTPAPQQQLTVFSFTV